MVQFAVLSILLFTLTVSVRGFTLDNPMSEALVSHSGPTNALYGHERFFDQPHDEHDRVKRGIYFNNRNNNFKNNQWPDLRIASEPPSEYLKMWLTSEHNRYRQMVPATNMRMLYWSEQLAASAQRHADRCDFRHSRDRVNVGENIWAAPYANYSDAITRWFQEVNDPRCGCNHAYKHCCGHYIQVVWAQTNLVGCGFSRCRDVWGINGRGHRNVFVCHYNPQGNTVFVNGNGQLYAVPAFNWATNNNNRCSECPSDAPACYQGLCYKPSISEKSTGTQVTTSESHNNNEIERKTSNDSRSFYKEKINKETEKNNEIRR